MIERHFGYIKGVIAIHDNLIIRVVSLSEHDKILRNKLERAKDAMLGSSSRKYS